MRTMRGSRRSFLVLLAAPALSIGCRRAPEPLPAREAGGPQHTPSDDEHGLAPDIRAVREYVLPLEAPPSFVFSTGFRKVP